MTVSGTPPAAGTPSVCAVIVTRNRRDLLAECLGRVRALERPVDELVVVDNASTDGTGQMVRERFPEAHLLALEANVGGAGGFHHGLSWAYARGHEWMWVMDDDTFVERDTLGALLAGAARAPAGRPARVLASRVLWKDGRLHPMNEPWPYWRRRGELARAVDAGLLLLRHATFVSAAIHREAVQRHGLPLAHYFVWTEDFEYTGRILREEAGYLVPESTVLHWTASPHTPVTHGGERFYYFVRNSLLLLRGGALSPAERAQYLRLYVRSLRDYGRRNAWDRTALDTIRRGIHDGLRDPVR